MKICLLTLLEQLKELVFFVDCGCQLGIHHTEAGMGCDRSVLLFVESGLDLLGHCVVDAKILSSRQELLLSLGDSPPQIL